MFKNYLTALFIILSFNLYATEYIELPAIDTQHVKQTAVNINGPLKYALATDLDGVYQTKHDSSFKQWHKNADGAMEYSIRFTADNATSLNVGMTDFFLPPTAELWVYNDDKSILRGPYTDRYNPKNGYFWIGDVPGDHVNLTFTVNAQQKKFLSFNIKQVARGFYQYWKSPTENGLKSGSCNVDVACPEGDDWRPEISSVGQYSFQIPGDGGYVCTGQLINNTAQDGTPYFLTASHCGYTGSDSSERDSVASSINIIWNYESQTCRSPGSGSSGTPINTGTFNQRQAGATLVAHNPNSDFALLLLNQTPNTSYDIQYTGWDRSDTAFNAGIGIHHPSGDAKRISFEDDALKITGYLQSNGGGTTHLRVIDWDKGTTEGGSSGSGLWNANYHLVGQLHGGYAACGNDQSDWYGRLYTSWDNGNSPEERLRDWLDPIDSNQMTLNTTGKCEAPVVTINTPSSLKVGQDAEFTATVTGGSGEYAYSWDLNGNGQTDGHGSSVSTRYSHAYVGNVSLRVTDSNGCQGVDSRAVIVEAPDIQFDGQASYTQLCGNNDNNIDPGERWRAQITTQNVGSQAATGTYLMLDSQTSQVSDNFGNSSQSCESSFIDISNSGTRYNWIMGPVTGTSADDEGYAKVQLSQPFQHYNQSVSTLVASTNGYLNTYANANGIDWDNDCPLPATPDKDSTGGRIAVMHADLNSSQFYHQHFNDCPRDAETGDNLACDVFLWKGAYFFGTGAIDSMDIQAILYPATSQWVFQYQGPGIDGSSATVGIQNNDADDALAYACNTADSISTEQAVCVFNKNHPNQSSGSELDLETPAVHINNMAVNANKTAQVDFSVDSDAVCGSELTINHTASVYDEGFNAGQPEAIGFEVGNNGQCQPVTHCEIDDHNTVQPEAGLWWNPQRSGNGLEFNVLDNDRLLYIMYTGQPDGSPIWYTADSDDSAFNNFYNDIYKVTYPGGFNAGNKQFQQVGWSNTYFLDAKNALQVRQINNQLSAEKLEKQVISNGSTVNEHTGQYYSCSDPGWGMTVFTEGNQRAVVSYIYDQEGNPYWTYAGGTNTSASMPMGHYDTFCPHCPMTSPEATAVGSMQLQMDGQTGGLIQSYESVYPAGEQPPQVEWQRSNLPLINVYTGGCQ